MRIYNEVKDPEKTERIFLPEIPEKMNKNNSDYPIMLIFPK